MKYQSSHKLKYKLPLIASEKEKQVTTAAEDVKTSDESTQEMIRQIFNEVLKQEEDCTPETWSRIRLKVINVEEVGTHTRRFTLQPALHKLFSTTKKNRLYSRLGQTQSEYQGGFRRSDQTLDHLATYGLLETEMLGVEYRNVGRGSALHEGVWLDTSPVFMESAWQMRYRITLHQLLEEATRGTERDILNGQRNRTCLSWRSERKGDFLSSLHFDTVLQMPLEDDVERWQKSKGMGVRLGDYESDFLTNMRVADDVFLFSTSLVQLQKVMCDFKQSTESVGLKIHRDKTIIPSSQRANRRK